MIVATTNDLTGHRIVRHIGMVRGVTVRSRNVISDAIGGVQSMIGGKVGAYVKLAEAARQDALGWQTVVTYAGGQLSVVALDREGHPVPGRIEGVLRRPLEGVDVPLSFGPRGSGRWAAEVQPPERGQWEARLTLFGPHETPFDIRHRVMVP